MNQRILCGCGCDAPIKPRRWPVVLLQLFAVGLFVVSCLAFVGCSVEQPWSYAPCYLEKTDSSSVVFYDCPDFRHNFTMELAEDKPDGTRFYALFTSPFGDDRVPRVWGWSSE